MLTVQERENGLVVLGSFSSKTRTSLKTLLLFHVLEHSNFPALSLPESCQQADEFPKNSSHFRISIICEWAHIAFCFPSRRPIFCSEAFKIYFQVASFRIERTISLSRLATVSKFTSLCNLHPRTKESCWRLLDSHLLAKTA